MSNNGHAPCMLEKVIFTPEAADDVAEAYAWYEEREPGLGEDFLRCVEACLLLVLRNPRLFPCALDDFRRALIRRFRLKFFTNRLLKVSLFTPYFIAPKTPESGAGGLATMTERV